ncbi:MAG: lysophospholipase [Deltaproteobacteria bacterium]|nr:MAG: lysophospholipase [Deltaproteobacteria bacterium]
MALAFAALAVLALAVAGGCSQTAMIFPAPAQGREPAYPENLVRTRDATFLYFQGAKVVAYFHGNGEDLADSVPMVSLLRSLRAESGVDAGRVVLLGQSLGAGVATEMAKRGLGARMVLVSPFTSVADMARRMVPFFPASWVRHRFDTQSKAAAIGLPVLIVHGTEDEVVPFAMGEQLARSFPRAQLVPIPGGQHNDLLAMHAIPMREALSPFLKF